MTSKKSAPIVALQPLQIDFTDPAYAAFRSMTPEMVQDGLKQCISTLNTLGYDKVLCLTDVVKPSKWQVLNPFHGK